MIRDLRKADAPRVLEFLKTQFPEEEALMGTRPEGFQKIIQRVFRWDTRFVMRLIRLFGRPAFRFFVVEEDGRIVATTLLSFPERAGWVSMVVVDPAYRRRGHAQALLERARETTQATGRRYIALDVLAQNAPARALYERLGYQPLRETSYMVRTAGTAATGPSSAASVRPFRDSDAPAVAAIARRVAPPAVQEVHPIRDSAYGRSGFVNRILENRTAAWVVDRGRGPEAYLRAVASPVTFAGHCSEPIVGEDVPATDVAALVWTAVDWCAANGAPQVVSQVPVVNVRGRTALQGGGFHDALTLWTLYRPVA
jgi:ribosomal protein S18 acetylase RimI-like enzyme